MWADVGHVMQKLRSAAPPDELLDGFPLLWRNPELLLGGRLWHRRLADDCRAAGSHPGCVRILVGVTVGPEHAVAEDDQQLVAVERFRIQHFHFVAEVDRDTELPVDGAAQTGADVVAVVIAIADEGERRRLGSRIQAAQQGDRRRRAGLQRGPPGYDHAIPSSRVTSKKCTPVAPGKLGEHETTAGYDTIFLYASPDVYSLRRIHSCSVNPNTPFTLLSWFLLWR